MLANAFRLLVKDSKEKIIYKFYMKKNIFLKF